MPKTLKRWPWVCLIALVSEVWAIRWRWESAPTDQLRVWYEDSFVTYLIESITPWLFAFTLLTALWLLVSRIRTKRKNSSIKT